MSDLSFHEVVFPLAVSRSASGGPERRTDIVALGSGREERNARWQHSRRKYDAGLGVRSLTDIRAVLSFFEERRGRLYGFRYHDPIDFCSHHTNTTPHATDVQIGLGNGTLSNFQLTKIYGSGEALYQRPIRKPVAGSVLLAVNGVPQSLGIDYIVDTATGVVSFLPGKIPANAATITAGFLFHVPVRFDTDRLDINLAAFSAGEIPSIPLIELVQ